MIEKELKLLISNRVDFVSITIHNNSKYPIASNFLNAGFHVICEKPMTFNSKKARDLVKLAIKNRRVFGPMHN